jgi:hypothetical protein
MGELVCFQQCPQSIACLPFLQSLNNNGEKLKTKNYTTLEPSLHFSSTNHELSFKLFFSPNQLVFPSQMMPCKLNHNLICVDLGPSSKGLGTNLKLLTYRNA